MIVELKGFLTSKRAGIGVCSGEVEGFVKFPRYSVQAFAFFSFSLFFFFSFPLLSGCAGGDERAEGGMKCRR